MKRTMLTVALLLSLILCSFSVYAANGDLIVNGKVGVGIGTSTPQTPLHVNGDITLGDATVGNMLGIHLGTSSGTDGSVIGLSASSELSISGDRSASLLLAGKNHGFSGDAILSAGLPSAGSPDHGFIWLRTNDHTQIAIRNNGEVGIGEDNTEPAATLDVKGTVKAFGGDWSSKTLGSAFLAESDGFVVANIIATSATLSTANIQGLTDSSNPPNSNSIRAYAHCYLPQGTGGSFTMPVKKGNYWQVVKPNTTPATVTIYWMPLGHQ